MALATVWDWNGEQWKTCPEGCHRSCSAKPEDVPDPAPRPADPVSNLTPEVTWYHRESDSIRSILSVEENYEVVHDGFKGMKEIVFLVGNDDLMLDLLKFHQRLTPHTAVVMIESWYRPYQMSAVIAYNTSLSLNMTGFMSKIPRNMGVHCIGHGLGAHVCGAVCRQFYGVQGRKCDRIVGLNPRGRLFQSNSIYVPTRDRRLTETDAKYVVVWSTDRARFSTPEYEAHEYITPDWDGMQLEMCKGEFERVKNVQVCASGYLVNNVCGTVSQSFLTRETYADACSNFMVIPIFMKSMDVSRGMVMYRSMTRPPTGIFGHLPTVWNGYVSGKDYRYLSYFNSQPVWYTTALNDRLEPYVMIVVLSLHGSNVRILDAKWSETIYYGSHYVVETALVDQKHMRRFKLRYSRYPKIFGAFVVIPQGCYELNCRIPMTSAYYFKTHCSPDSRAFTSVCTISSQYEHRPVLRKMLDVTGLHVSVPPLANRCLKDKAVLSELRTSLGMVSVREGELIRVAMNASAEWFFDLFRVELVLPSAPKEPLPIFSYWDACHNDHEDYLTARIDRSHGRFMFKFHRAGEYTLRFVYDLEVVELKCQVSAGAAEQPEDSATTAYSSSKKPTPSTENPAAAIELTPGNRLPMNSDLEDEE